MKILLTGAAGQLGQELWPRLQALGEVIAVDVDPSHAGEVPCARLDLSDGGRLEVFLNRSRPDLLVNAAAYTAVDPAEQNRDTAFEVNAKAPGRIARWAQRNDAALLHYSTDYVFDGRADEPYRESDPASPLNTYGQSKLEGERAIQASGCRHLILRSSWIYSGHGKNFVLTMLGLAARNPHLRVVGDQVGCPTWARNLANYSMPAIKKGLVGRRALPQAIYHCCDADQTSWYDFATRVFDNARRLGLIEQAPELTKVASSDYPQAAERPRWSVLSTSAMRRDLGMEPRGLEESLNHCLEEMKSR